MRLGPDLGVSLVRGLQDGQHVPDLKPRPSISTRVFVSLGVKMRTFLKTRLKYPSRTFQISGMGVWHWKSGCLISHQAS